MDTRVLECIEKIQPPPVVVTQLISILSTEYHADDILDILKSDPALTGSVLKKCNTAYFAQRAGATSMKQAIQLLGTSTIMNMVLELTVSQNLDKELSFYGLPRSGLRQHSFFTALACKELTQHCAVLNFTSDTAFTAGLLHDIGKIAVNEALTANNLAVEAMTVDSEKSGIEMEHCLLGTDHAEVGAVILEKWNFPELFFSAVGQHHQPSIKNQLSHLIHIANWCAHSAVSTLGVSSTTGKFGVESLTSLSLVQEDLDLVTQKTHDQLDQYFQISESGVH